MSRHYGAWQDKLRYDLLADRRNELFGAENLLLVPCELLQQDPHAFVSRICRFIGCPVPQYAMAPVNVFQRGLALLRFNRLLNVVHGPINKFLDRVHRARRGDAARFRGPTNSAEKHVKKTLRRARQRSNAWIAKSLPCRELTRDDVIQVLGSRLDPIAESNRRVSGDFSLGLKGYGYFLETQAAK